MSTNPKTHTGIGSIVNNNGTAYVLLPSDGVREAGGIEELSEKQAYIQFDPESGEFEGELLD